MPPNNDWGNQRSRNKSRHLETNNNKNTATQKSTRPHKKQI